MVLEVAVRSIKAVGKAIPPTTCPLYVKIPQNKVSYSQADWLFILVPGVFPGNPFGAFPCYAYTHSSGFPYSRTVLPWSFFCIH